MTDAFLHQRVSWGALLPALGVQTAAAVLPALVVCPVCQSRSLRVYHDPVLGGQWCHCGPCQWAGDLIEFTARATGLPITEAIHRIGDMTSCFTPQDLHPDSVDAYLNGNRALRLQLRVLWSTACAAFRNPETREARILVGLVRKTTESESQSSDVEPFVGLATRSEFDAATNWSHSQSGSVRGRAMPARPGHPVVLVGHYDMPGRLCGLTALWSEDDKTVRSLFRRTFRTFGSPNTDTGVGMLPTVQPGRVGDSPSALLKSTRILCDDACVALALHARHSRVHTTVLPLGTFTYYDRRTSPGTIWRTLAMQNIVFWSPTLSVGAIVQARNARGLVSCYQARTSTSLTPVDVCRNVAAEGVSWHAALRMLLDRCDPTQTAEILRQVEMRPDELREFIAGCRGVVATKIREGLAAEAAVRQIEWQGKTYLERNGEWLQVKVDRRGVSATECISDAVVRIEEVLQGEGDATEYRGRILYRGAEYPFASPAAKMAKLLSWAHAFIRDTARAGLTVYAKRMDSEALQIAIQFSEPRIIPSSTRVGWDDDRHAFLFRDFSIDARGFVEQSPPVMAKTAPAMNIVAPGDHCWDPVVRFLNHRTPETEVFWAMFTAAAYNVLAPARRMPPLRVAMVGDGAASMGAAAAGRLGMLRHALGTGNLREIVSGLQSTHAWPPYFSTSRSDWNWLHEDECTGRSGFFCEMPWQAGYVVAMRDNWAVIDQPRKLGQMQFIPMAAGTLLTHFIKYVCREGLWTFSVGDDDVLERLLHEIRAWYKEIGDVRAPSAGLAVLRTPTRPKVDYLGEIFCRLHRFRTLRIEEGPLNAATCGAAVRVGGEKPYVWIPQRDVSEALERGKGLPLDVLVATRVMKEAGVLFSESVSQGRVGWMVQQEWFNKVLSMEIETCTASPNENSG